MPVAVAEEIVSPEEFLALPDPAVFELVDGELLEKNVSLESSRVEGRCIIRLGLAAEEHDCTLCTATLSYRCFPDDPDKFRRPDVTLVRNDRLGELDDPKPGVMPIPPDLAVEVVSDNDLARDVDAKAWEYVEAGFGLVWVLFPESRSVHVYAAGGSRVLGPGDRIDAGDLLPGWSCRVAELFGE